MTDSDDEDVPESDPYCAHWFSIYDDPTPDHPVLCTNCGHPCTEHPALFGTHCYWVDSKNNCCNCMKFTNAEWPADEVEKPLARKYCGICNNTIEACDCAATGRR